MFRQKILPALFCALGLSLASSFPAVAQQSGGQIISRDVVVLEGETLQSIAKREFGKGGLAWHLAESNNLKVNAKLVPGDVLRIPLFVPARDEYATIVFSKGTVTRDGEILNVDDKIFLNDTIETDSSGFVSVVFESGSVVNLQPNSTAKLVQLHCLPQDDSCLIEVRSDKGELSSDVESSNDQPTDFRITTPYATAAVRGTTLDFGAVDGKMIVGVTEGRVNLQASGARVPLDAGFGSVTSSGSAPSEPVPLLPPPVYRYIPTRAAAGDSLRWWELTSVGSYAAVISNDSGGNDVVEKFAGAQSTVTVGDNLSPGNYYVAVRGIDDAGIKGFKSSSKFTVAAIDPSLIPVDTTIEREGNEYLVTVVNPYEQARGYEIQVSYSENFEDPLSADISPAGVAIFRLEEQQNIYARARILMDPTTVSGYGKVASLTQ